MPRLSSTVIATFVSLALALAIPEARASDVIEYYHSGLDHYFITNDANEIRVLDSGGHQGWARTGHTFQVFDVGDPRLANSLPVCRFYGNPLRGLDSHFFSATPQECAEVKVRFPDAWLLESDEVFRVHGVNPVNAACPASTRAVYRLYNQRADVNHRYTTDASVVDAMLARGYLLEGSGSPRPIVFCAADLTTAPPTCSLVPSSASPAVNTTLTLTASCTNEPTAYQWTNCAGSTSTCMTSESTAGVRVYSVTASNSSGVSAPAFVSINWQQPVTGPPVCTLSASPATPFVGVTAILTANCTQSPTSYSWANCSGANGNVCHATSAQTGTVTYSVTATNAFGAGPPASIMLDWQPPPPPGADLCGSYAKVMRVDVPWGGFVDSNDPGGGFEDDMVLSARFTVPASATGTSVPGVVSAVEHVDGPAARILSISPSACDFRGFVPGVYPSPDPSGASRPIAWGFSINPSVNFALSTMPGSHPKLVPGQTYYINIRNADFGGAEGTCPTPECNVRVTVNAPH
jgi:hypothetical protein